MADGPDAPERVPPAIPQGYGEAGAEPADSSAASSRDREALKLEKKRRKLRAAWIAFAGRILAQLIGAVATVLLGIYVVRTYGVERPARKAAPGATAAAPAAPEAPRARLSLVVLPFQSFSPSSPSDYLSDGLTEALIADLSRSADLRVISRTSSMYYKGTTKTLPIIARELNVDLVVEGSVAREGARVRVTAQLIDAASDTHLWSRTYDRTTSDVLALQAEVTHAIALELHAAITPRQELALALRSGIDPDTYDAYLRGRQAIHRRAPSDLRDAAMLFERVIAKAPGFAPAHAALAEVWCLRAVDAFGAVPARDALDKAEAAALAALRLDAGSADAHLALAMVRHRRDWDWAGAEREFTRVFELREGHATAHQWYAIFLAEQGRYDQARQQAARAIAFDPNAAPVHRTAGLVSLYAGRLTEAAASLRRSLAIDPSAGVTRLLLASVLLEQGKHEDARKTARLVRDEDLQDQRLSLLAVAAVRGGDRATALRYQDEARALPGPHSLVADARFAAALGDAPMLLAAAARAVESRTQLACALKVHPVFASVRHSPDFQALVRKVGA